MRGKDALDTDSTVATCAFDDEPTPTSALRSNQHGDVDPARSRVV